MGWFDAWKKRERSSSHGPAVSPNKTIFGANCPKHLQCSMSLSDFRFIRAIGNGYAAMIFEAEHIPSKSHCVLKVCMKTRLGIDELRRMQREIELHSIMNHPFILHMYAAFEDKHAFYLVLEYAPHGDLLSYLSKQTERRVPHQQIVFFIIEPILLAVHYLHQKGIIHRDIKPENILIDEKYTIRLCDFGMAINSIRERPHSILGTLEYMAPELILQNTPPFTEKLDIWAIGVLTYECLVGKSPFAASKEKEIMHNIVHAQYDHNAIHSSEARDFIRCCLQVDPEQRWSAKQLLSHPMLNPAGGDANGNGCVKVRRSLSYS